MKTAIGVLHVEDDEPFADLTAEYLERENERISVETATTPKEGLKLLTDNKYDCIVSDYDMPGNNGIEFLKTVRETHPDIPFILFTGKGSEEVASKAISAGVSDYLQKKPGTERYELLANRIVNNVVRTRVKRNLEERNAHLQQAQSIANLGSWEKDIRTDEIYWSESVYDIFRIDDRESFLDHEQFLQCVHPADRTAVDEAWNEALEGDEYDIKHRIVTADGETRWVRERAEITFDEAGTPVKALGIVQDITNQKERNEQLQQTSARLKAVFKHSPDMINFHNSEGEIIEPNPRLCERTGYSESELTDMFVWELDQEITPDEAKAVWEQIQPGDRYKVKSTYECRDGSTFPVEAHIRRLDHDDPEHFVAISRELNQPDFEASREQAKRDETVSAE